MRASQQGHHVSGAERIVDAQDAERTAVDLIRRARTHPKGSVDSITLTITHLDRSVVRRIPALTVDQRYAPDSVNQAHGIVDKLLGTPHPLKHLLSVHNLPGARLIFPDGTALDGYVRVSTFDWNVGPETPAKNHRREALALASKVAACPGITAEVCMSDDPDYTTGYVSIGGTYYPIPHMKMPGSPYGGRVFVISPDADLDELRNFLRDTPVIVYEP